MRKVLLTKTAEAISIIFNPFLLGLIILLMTVYKTKFPIDIKFAWYVAVIVINGFIPSVIYFALRSIGYVFDDGLSNGKVHKQRLILLASLLLLVTIEFLILVFTGGTQPFLAVLTGGMLTIILGISITYFWKISWHSAVTTLFSFMLIYIYSWKAWYAIIVLLLIFWSRLYLKRHTIWQLMAGLVIAILVVYGTFRFYNLS
jgi:membrane-associated phospholipid phosphatase